MNYSFESTTLSISIMTRTLFILQGNLRKMVVLGLTGMLLLVFNNLSAQTPEAEKNFQQCKACHNIDGPKLIGPNLAGLTATLDTAWLIRFIRNSTEVIQSGDEYAVALFEEYHKIPMPAHDLTDEQIIDILAYIDNGGKVADEYLAQMAEAADGTAEAAAQRQAELKDRDLKMAALERDANRNFGTTFIVTLLILIVTLFDLFVTKVIRATFVHKTVVLIALVIVAEVVYKEASALGRQHYYQPDQPIWFSHEIHATQNDIDCLYCHSSAEDSKSAGIPSVNVCMNCHNVVRTGTMTGTTEIDKIYEAWDSGKPIEWIRVHNLPDHVYFNHSQHVNSGKLDCAECHGEVEKMDVVMQVEDLSMGWCLDCHRTTEVQFATNDFFKSYERMHEQFKNGKVKRVTADMLGGSDCMKCHY